MKIQLQSTKQFIATHKPEVIASGVGLVSIVAVIALIVLIAHNVMPAIVYQPTRACDLFTMNDAKTLLGNNAIHSGLQEPKQSRDTATSNCGYTDGDPDTNAMVVAAIVVRSGINDKGIAQNKAEFATGKPTSAAEEVKGIGESAYFNERTGQLNILDGRRWIILSYGVGADPTGNTVDQAVKLAHIVLK